MRKNLAHESREMTSGTHESKGVGTQKRSLKSADANPTEDKSLSRRINRKGRFSQAGKTHLTGLEGRN